MSSIPRRILGSFAILFALIFVNTAHNSSVPWADWGLVAFCLAIVIACFSKKGRVPAIKFIGIAVFLAYLNYFAWEIITNFRKLYTGPAQARWLNAIFGMFTFGLPGLYVMLNGIYPKWGLRSEVFRGNEEGSNPKDTSSQKQDENHLP
jgi:hypothetical protein